jgi:hypothetical protein
MGRTLDFDWLPWPETTEGWAAITGTLWPTDSDVRSADTRQPQIAATHLERLTSTDIESLYTGLEKRLSQRTLHFLHCTLGACLGAAVRSRRLVRSPVLDMAVTPSPGVGEHGNALEPHQLEALLQGFKGTVYFPIVAVAAFTGARRNEVLALRGAIWTLPLRPCGLSAP